MRLTPGIDADTHEKVRTAHHGSKFGLPPDDAVEALRLVPECEGLHVHVGSQLTHFGASLETVDWLGAFVARLRAELGWEPRILDLGGGLGVRHVLEEPDFTIGDFAGGLLGRARGRLGGDTASTRPQLMLEPGRSLVARAGLTLYTVGAVKSVGAATTFVTVDGGMSDNPRPALYGARYTAILANRADEPADHAYAVAGKHCESGDVLIDRVKLPAPRRGDILAVPVTGAYTLSMSSTYNAVPRPAAVLVADGEARLIRRREIDRRPARARSLSLFPQLAQTRALCSGTVLGGGGLVPLVGWGADRGRPEAQNRASEPRSRTPTARSGRDALARDGPQQPRGRGSRASLTCGFDGSASGAAPNEARDPLLGRVAVERRALARDAAGGADQRLHLLRRQLLARTPRRPRARSTRSSASRRGR